MSTLDARGHEVVDPKPFEPVVPINRKRVSVSDMVRAEIMRARQAAADEIRSDEDMVEDLTDFADDSPSDELIGPSPYEIPEDIPDGPMPVLTAPEETPAAPDANVQTPAAPEISKN